MLFDFDNTLGNDHARWTRVTGSSTQIGKICKSLLRSSQFKTLLLETTAQLIENGLSDEYCLRKARSIFEELEPESERNLLRWGERRYRYEQYKTHIEKVFSGGRIESWLTGLQSLVNASDDVMLSYFPDYY